MGALFGTLERAESNGGTSSPRGLHEVTLDAHHSQAKMHPTSRGQAKRHRSRHALTSPEQQGRRWGRRYCTASQHNTIACGFAARPAPKFVRYPHTPRAGVRKNEPSPPPPPLPNQRRVPRFRVPPPQTSRAPLSRRSRAPPPRRECRKERFRPRMRCTPPRQREDRPHGNGKDGATRLAYLRLSPRAAMMFECSLCPGCGLRAASFKLGIVPTQKQRAEDRKN